jgi:hypothetical protein
VPRVLLGEFGETFAKRASNGLWIARVPSDIKEAQNVFYGFIEDRNVRELSPAGWHPISIRSFGRYRGDVGYESLVAASMASLLHIQRTALSDNYYSKWHEDEEIVYSVVNVRDL